MDPEKAVAAVRDALVEAVRARLAAPRHAPESDLVYGPGDGANGANGVAYGNGVGNGAGGAPGGDPYAGDAYGDAHDYPYEDDPFEGAEGNSAYSNGSWAGTHAAHPGQTAHGAHGFDGRDPGPVPGMGPADRRAARGGPAPGIGADLSGGPASGTLALLAAGLPGMPGTVHGTSGTDAGERLLAVTFNDLATSGHFGLRTPSWSAHASIAENPRLHHVVVAAAKRPCRTPTWSGPLTDEPGPSLVVADRHRQRLAAGSSDHFVGLGARQVLDAHPARLADLLMDRRRRHLLRPVAALARAEDVRAGPVGARAVDRLPRGAQARPYAVPGRRRPRRPSGCGRAASRATGRAAAGVRTPPPASVRTRGTDSPISAPSEAQAATAARARSAPRSPRSPGAGPGPAARWLTGEALAEVSLRLEAAARHRPSSERPGERRARAALARQAADHRVLEQAAEIRNQRLHAPFLDNQVVRACRDLPEALRVQPGARASVLRAVLEGAGVHDLPAGWGAPSYAYQAAAVRAGLRAAADELLQLFDAPLLADAGLVEARVVRKALRAASEGEPLPLDGLADLVSTELWLRRLISRRGTCWTGSAAPRQRAVAAGVLPAQQRPAL